MYEDSMQPKLAYLLSDPQPLFSVLMEFHNQTCNGCLLHIRYCRFFISGRHDRGKKKHAQVRGCDLALYKIIYSFKGGPSDLRTKILTKKKVKNHPYTPKAFSFS